MSEYRVESQESNEELGQPKVVQDSFHEAKVREYQEHIADIYSISFDEDAARKKVEEIGKKLEGDTPFKGQITYKVIHHSEENAFACGTTVYVYSGLLVALKTESEVAGVIAHELSHIEHGDTTKLNGARRTFWEEISRGRIQEYLADSVLHKMHQGGYHPAAYERVLQYLAYGQRSVGFTHGASSDRQAAYRAQLHVFDLETTAQPDTSVRPSEFSPETLKPLLQKSTFEEIREMAKGGKVEAILHAIGSINTTSLLILWSEETTGAGELVRKMQSNSYRRYNNSRERAEHMQALKKHALLLNALNEGLARRVTDKLPEVPSALKSWLRIILLSDSQSLKSDGLEEMMRFTEKKTKIPMPKFRTELNESVTGTDNLIELAKFTRTYDQHTSTLGVTVDATVHPESVFTTDSSGPYLPKEPDSFFRTTFTRALANEGLSDPLDVLVAIGESLSVFSTNKASRSWFQAELDVFFQAYIKSVISGFSTRRRKKEKKYSASERLEELQKSVSQSVVRYGGVLARAGFSGAEPHFLEIAKKEMNTFFTKAKIGYREANAFDLQLASAVTEAKREQDELFRSFSLASSLTPDAQRDYLRTLRFSDLLKIRSIANFNEVCPDPAERKVFKENIISFLLEEYVLTQEDFSRIRLLAERRGFLQRSSGADSFSDSGGSEKTDKNALEESGINEETCRLLAALQFESLFGQGKLSDAVLEKLNTLWKS